MNLLLPEANILSRIIPSCSNFPGRLFRIFLLTVATITAGLAYLSGAATIQVNLQRALDVTTQTHILRFGYWYELNAAFFYVVCAPFFALWARKFFDSAQFAIEELIRLGRLTSIRTTKDRAIAGVVADPRLGIIWLTTAAMLLGGVASIVYKTELDTRKGNKYNLAFGYVQAPFITDYVGHTLEDLSKQRTVREIAGIPRSEYKNWKIQGVLLGSGERARGLLFQSFILGALGLQIVFIPFAIWVILKCVYLFYFFYRGAHLESRYKVKIELDCTNVDKRFGLGVFDTAFNDAAILVAIGAVGANAAVISNLGKGSFTVQSGASVNPFALLGQNILSILPLMLASFMVVFTVLFHLQAERFRQHAIRNGVSREKANQQSTWPSIPVVGLIGLSSMALLAPSVLFAQNPAVAEKINDGWHGLINSLLNIIQGIQGGVGVWG